MNKAEKFIKDCTRGCSNELIAVTNKDGKKVVSYHEWITPEQALKAVEIERENIVEKFCEYQQDKNSTILFNSSNIGKNVWSEEDEKMYNRIFDLIHAAAYANYEVDEDGKECGEYAKIIGWFKFLKDQHTWKVSDLQIEALESAAQNCAYSEYKDCLQELTIQLKKLKR